MDSLEAQSTSYLSIYNNILSLWFWAGEEVGDAACYQLGRVRARRYLGSIERGMQATSVESRQAPHAGQELDVAKSLKRI